MQSEHRNEEPVVDALRQITGSESVRVQVGEDAEGRPRNADGYLVNEHEYVFRNDKQQSTHVPIHRVKDVIAKAATARAAKAGPPK